MCPHFPRKIHTIVCVYGMQCTPGMCSCVWYALVRAMHVLRVYACMGVSLHMGAKHAGDNYLEIASCGVGCLSGAERTFEIIMGVRTLQLPLLGRAVLSGALGQETRFKINRKLV